MAVELSEDIPDSLCLATYISAINIKEISSYILTARWTHKIPKFCLEINVI